jgi:hypothetical protein
MSVTANGALCQIEDAFLNIVRDNLNVCVPNNHKKKPDCEEHKEEECKSPRECEPGECCGSCKQCCKEYYKECEHSEVCEKSNRDDDKTKCPCPKFLYKRVICEFPCVKNDLEHVLEQLYDGCEITDAGVSFFLLLALKDVCDSIVRKILDSVCGLCPDIVPSNVDKLNVLSSFVNIVPIDMNIVYLLLLIIAYVGEVTSKPCESGCDGFFWNNPESKCETNCCERSCYGFDINCVQPIALLALKPRRDIAFNLLLMSFIFLMQLSKFKLCFDGFFVKTCIRSDGCSNQGGYILDQNTYDFYKSVRNTYNKVIDLMPKRSPETLFYLLTCNCPAYLEYIGKLFCHKAYETEDRRCAHEFEPSGSSGSSSRSNLEVLTNFEYLKSNGQITIPVHVASPFDYANQSRLFV